MKIIGVIIGIWVASAFIAHIVERHRQSIIDRAAHEVLDKTFDYEKEKQEILAVNSQFVPEENRCPKCNSILILRKGRYGKFIGCSDPYCRFTKKV